MKVNEKSKLNATEKHMTQPAQGALEGVVDRASLPTMTFSAGVFSSLFSAPLSHSSTDKALQWTKVRYNHTRDGYVQ